MGLRRDSRIKQKLSGLDYSIDEIMTARMVDSLALLVWANTQDAMHGKNRPKSLLDALLGRQKENDTVAFYSPEAFEQAMKKYERS